MFMGTVPATRYPHMGNVPAASTIGGLPMPEVRPNQTTVLYPETQVFAYPLQWHDDGSHLMLRPGEPVFAARHKGTEDKNGSLVVLTVGHLNIVLRQGYEHYLRSLGASPDSERARLASRIGDDVLLDGQSLDGDEFVFGFESGRRMASLDHIGNGDRWRRDEDTASIDSSANGASITKAEISRLRALATVTDEGNVLNLKTSDGLYTPSPLRIYMRRKPDLFPPAHRSSPSAKNSVLLRQALDHIKESGQAVNEGHVLYLERRIHAIEENENARERLDEFYETQMQLHGRYASRYEFSDYWNPIGVVLNTNYGRDAVTEPLRGNHSHAWANICIGRKIRVLNVWADHLNLGERLFFIHGRQRYDDGTYGPYQIRPYHCNAGEEPPISERSYLNIAGEFETGQVIFFGTVYEKMEGNPSSEHDRMAYLGLHPDMSWKQAYEAGGRLNYVTIQLRGR